MHNEEGKLFEAVFHKLLALGVVIVAVAVVVWVVWAIARASQISNEAATPPEPAAGDATLLQAPRDRNLLANARPTMPGPDQASTGVGSPDRIIALTLQPVAVLVSRVHGRLPAILERAAADTAFFVGGPS